MAVPNHPVPLNDSISISRTAHCLLAIPTSLMHLKANEDCKFVKDTSAKLQYVHWKFLPLIESYLQSICVAVDEASLHFALQGN